VPNQARRAGYPQLPGTGSKVYALRLGDHAARDFLVRPGDVAGNVYSAVNRILGHQQHALSSAWCRNVGLGNKLTKIAFPKGETCSKHCLACSSAR